MHKHNKCDQIVQIKHRIKNAFKSKQVIQTLDNMNVLLVQILQKSWFFYALKILLFNQNICIPVPRK